MSHPASKSVEKSSRLAILLAPIKAFRLRYLPLLMIYFAYGASAFSAVADSFFVKEHLSISAAGLMTLGVWLSLPWTIKMVFGQLVDCLPIFGSARRIYIFIAAGMMVIGSLLLAGLAGGQRWVISLAAPVTLYFVAKLLTVIAIVLQDVVADAMSVEVVERVGRSESEINHDLAMVQLLGRLALGFAIFLVAGLGGWLAQIYSYETMYLLTLIIPVISVIGCMVVRLNGVTPRPLNKVVFIGGMLFGVAVVILGLLHLPYDQEIIFLISLFVVCFFLKKVTEKTSAKARRHIFAAAIVIFFFRAMPGVGPALQWWQIDVLGFSKAFFGTLGQIGAGLSILGMWVMARYITEKPIGLILLVLTIFYTLFSIPTLALYYGLHHWTESHFGFGAHTIALIDAAIESPFAQLSMIPMLTLIAINAPRGQAATWFALMASLMNLALTGGAIVTKLLNQVWVVSRTIKDSAGSVIVAANYDHLGALLWISIIVGLLVPVVLIFIFMRQDLRKS